MFRMPPITIDQAMQLAVQHHEAGRLHEAEQLYRQILIHVPLHAPAIHHLGLIAHSVGRPDTAVDLIRKAISLRPNDAEPYNNLGNILREKGDLDGAVAACRRAVALKPDLAEGFSNLGAALKDKGLLDEAISDYRRAIALKPNYCEANHNLGIALNERGLLDEAVASYRRAIASRPGYTDAHNNLGVALKDSGQVDESIAAHRRAVALSPENHEAHSNLVLTLHYHPAYDARALSVELCKWSERHAKPLPRLAGPYQNGRDPDRRLKIGYFSPDFRDHVVGRNLLPILRGHDRERFEVFCYSNVQRPDNLTTQFRSLCDCWRSINDHSDQQVAELVRQDQIDILIDLALHSAHNRLLVFARKPAPVQVTWAGYPGTTGLEAIDYRLTDPYLDPPETDDAFYSEKSFRLPDSFWCYDPAVMTAGLELGSGAGPLPAMTTGTVTFGCLNNFCKVNDQVLSLWARVLNAVAGSRLILMVPQGSARRRVLDFLGQEGIDPGRVSFVAHCSMGEYFRIYNQIDIALDTFPYNGHTTSLDAMWMGVPVVTLVGQTVVGRAGLSQLSNLRLTELIARTADEYVDIVVKLVSDLPKLAELRSTLRRRMLSSPLTDAVRFARNIEAAYREMWRIWCAGRNGD